MKVSWFFILRLKSLLIFCLYENINIPNMNVNKTSITKFKIGRGQSDSVWQQLHMFQFPWYLHTRECEPTATEWSCIWETLPPWLRTRLRNNFWRFCSTGVGGLLGGCTSGTRSVFSAHSVKCRFLLKTITIRSGIRLNSIFRTTCLLFQNIIIHVIKITI